jgi:DNA-binding NarL/FixJ family response regulator
VPPPRRPPRLPGYAVRTPRLSTALHAAAAALTADDGATLLAASVQLERIALCCWPPPPAHRLAQACEGARTPALAALAAPLPLTRREREIVTLAAGGLSNRQIADRLVVSVRTVEGHLYRACAKLGVSDPSELAPLLDGD